MIKLELVHVFEYRLLLFITAQLDLLLFLVDAKDFNQANNVVGIDHVEDGSLELAFFVLFTFRFLIVLFRRHNLVTDLWSLVDVTQSILKTLWVDKL